MSSPSTSRYTSASTSASICRTTLPLPGIGERRTTAPAAAATSPVVSAEPLSYTYTQAEGRASRKGPYNLSDCQLLVQAGHQHGD